MNGPNQNPVTNGSSAPQELEATTRAVLAADGAQREKAMASVRWERRGLLQRLTRS